MKNKIARLTAGFLAGLFALTLRAPLWARDLPAFKDVKRDAWYYPYVQALLDRRVVKGFGDTGEFRPELMLRRDHACKMVARGASLAFLGKEASLPDVDPKGEMSPYIAVLGELGAFSCYPDGSFKPKDKIKRGEAARMVALGFQLERGDRPCPFPDLPEDPDIREAIRILASHSIVQGYRGGEDFRPEEEISRALFSKIICLAMAVKEEELEEDPPQKPPDPPEDPDQPEEEVPEEPPPDPEVEDEVPDPPLDPDKEEEPPDPEDPEPDEGDEEDPKEEGPEDPEEEEVQEPSPIQITSLLLVPERLILMEGEEGDLTAILEPEEALATPLTWTSSHEEIARVDQGRVTALTEGEATITVEAGGLSASSRVTVLSEEKPVYNQTRNTRHATIGEAIEEAGEDNVLLAGPKTYQEAVRISKKGLTLRSLKGPDKTVIDAKKGYFAVQIMDKDLGPVHFEGFTVRGWKWGGILQAKDQGGEGGAFHVLNNILESPPTSTLYGHSIQVSGKGSVIRGNQVESHRSGNSLGAVAGILVINSSHVLVENNQVYGGDEGITIKGESGEDPDLETRQVRILENDIHEVETGIAFEGYAYEVTIQGNRFADLEYGLKKKKGSRIDPDLDLDQVLEDNFFPEGFRVRGNCIEAPK